jgi:predicted nucleotidyltransferase
MTELKKDILITLAYFDLFKHPLTPREIYLFLGRNYQIKEFEIALMNLTAEKQIFELKEFYALRNDLSLAERRKQGNEYAGTLLKTAKKVASVLSYFPYVRGIAVSGSLSKNYADSTSDIDLFIITAKNKVWTTRTLMHCLKKISFLFKKEHLLCMNYYIDETELEIAEKNIYTATEIVTLMPMFGATIFDKFYTANKWTISFLPNHFIRIMSAPEINMNWIKLFAEQMGNNFLGSAIENLLMKITRTRWNKKTKQHQLTNQGLVMSLDAGKHHAKPDPTKFQNKLLQLYENKAWQVLQKLESGKANKIQQSLAK